MIFDEQIQKNFKRFVELQERFEFVARKRRKWDYPTRLSLVQQSLQDMVFFAENLIRLHGSVAFPAVDHVAKFLEDRERGAPRLVEVTLSSVPTKLGVPFIPAEYVARQCVNEARAVRRAAINSFGLE